MKTCTPVAVASFWDEFYKIAAARAPWTPAHLHKVAAQLGMDHNSEEFKARCQTLVGKAHLDEMSSAELQKVAVSLLRQKKEKVAALLGGITKMMKPPSTPQVSRALTLKPMSPSSADIKVPSAVSARAGTATNVTDLKAPSAIYG